MPTVYKSQKAYSDQLKDQFDVKTYSDITINFKSKNNCNKKRQKQTTLFT
jgi:hypothetical protein